MDNNSIDLAKAIVSSQIKDTAEAQEARDISGIAWQERQKASEVKRIARDLFLEWSKDMPTGSRANRAIFESISLAEAFVEAINERFPPEVFG